MFAFIEYLLTVTFIISILILNLLLPPLAILCTTIGVFGDWPHRISFLKNGGTRRHALSNSSTTATGTNTTSISDHSTMSLSNDLDSTPRTSTSSTSLIRPSPSPSTSLEYASARTWDSICARPVTALVHGRIESAEPVHVYGKLVSAGRIWELVVMEAAPAVRTLDALDTN
ncbi:hypothetical protein XPA_010674 [Xanthoria parietina]